MKKKPELYHLRKEIYDQYQNGYQIIDLATTYETSRYVIQGILEDHLDEIIEDFRKLPPIEKENKQELQRIRLKIQIQNDKTKNQD